MRRVAVAITLALATVPFAAAQTQNIFKCVDGEVISYQSMPCGAGQTEARVMTIARAASVDAQAQSAAVTPRVDSVVPTALSRGKMWPARRTLMLGMSDDEVLNLPGWGVPKQIVRTKAAREWREEWTYPTAEGERRLYFVNATLVDAAIDGSQAQHVASDRRAYPAS